MIERITVVVPVRAGSERFPDKNLARIRVGEHPQRSLLAWKLDQLLQVFPAENIVVSSDSQRYLDEAGPYGVRLHIRSRELSTTDVPFHRVVTELAQQVQTEFLGWAPVTSPLFGPKHTQEMVADFAELSRSQQSAGFVTMERLHGFFAHGGEWLNFAAGLGHKNSQDLVRPMRITWGFTLRATADARESGGLISDPTLFFEVPHWAALDIDYSEDLRTAVLLSPLYAEFESAGFDASTPLKS